jgi:hypothetical protein
MGSIPITRSTLRLRQAIPGNGRSAEFLIAWMMSWELGHGTSPACCHVTSRIALALARRFALGRSGLGATRRLLEAVPTPEFSLPICASARRTCSSSLSFLQNVPAIDDQDGPVHVAGPV